MVKVLGVYTVTHQFPPSLGKRVGSKVQPEHPPYYYCCSTAHIYPRINHSTLRTDRSWSIWSVCLQVYHLVPHLPLRELLRVLCNTVHFQPHGKKTCYMLRLNVDRENHACPTRQYIVWATELYIAPRSAIGDRLETKDCRQSTAQTIKYGNKPREEIVGFNTFLGQPAVHDPGDLKRASHASRDF